MWQRKVYSRNGQWQLVFTFVARYTRIGWYVGAKENMIEELRNLLWQVQTAAGSNFSGLGLLICDTPEILPILPLRSLSFPEDSRDLITVLVAISNTDSEYHDGFHVVSSEWRLSRVSQYFSPPIIENGIIDRSKAIGGRYVAALFGSAIPAVQLTGIASRGFGVAIFEDGAERYFEGVT